LQESEENYRNLFENASEAIFVAQDGKLVFLNPMTARMIDYSAEEIMSRPFIEFIHPDDRDMVIDRHYRRMKEETLPPIYSFRIIHRDGNVRWVELNTVFINWKGETATLNFLSNITERKQAEEALQESELKYRTLVELTHDFVFMVDRKGLFTYVNPNFEKTTGYSFSDLKGHPFTIVIAPDERETIIDRFKKGVRGAPSLPYETELSDKEGKRVAVEFLTSNLCDIRGNVTGRFGVGRDITKRKEVEALLRDSEKRYRDLSIIDDLTQLYNSRYFYHQLKMEIDLVNRYEEQSMTLLLLDLDDFKQFNDAYGHVEGDQVILRLGQLVKRCLRQTDSAYRYGGEEFTILLPMTTSKDAAVTAERIRTEFKKENFPPVSGKEVHMTVSIGLAQYKPQEDMKAFVHRVDQLMYQAKKNGKDRVCSES
jgi:diguanylate cyclase (GGDEF)-like protein/PAS domain S-box-containing protein